MQSRRFTWTKNRLVQRWRAAGDRTRSSDAASIGKSLFLIGFPFASWKRCWCLLVRSKERVGNSEKSKCNVTSCYTSWRLSSRAAEHSMCLWRNGNVGMRSPEGITWANYFLAKKRSDDGLSRFKKVRERESLLYFICYNLYVKSSRENAIIMFRAKSLLFHKNRFQWILQKGKKRVKRRMEMKGKKREKTIHKIQNLNSCFHISQPLGSFAIVHRSTSKEHWGINFPPNRCSM